MGMTVSCKIVWRGKVTLNNICGVHIILSWRNITGAHSMLVLFSFSMEPETAPEVTTKSPSPGQGPTCGQAPLQPRPGGKTLTSLGRPSELEARHVIPTSLSTCCRAWLGRQTWLVKPKENHETLTGMLRLGTPQLLAGLDLRSSYRRWP